MPQSKVPLELISLLKGKDVMVGAIDVATEKVESPADVARTIRAALKYVPADKLYPCTNCGMVPLPRAVALGKMKALAAGAPIVRAELTRARSGSRR
ncbi:MAG: 5-methyltetrahydropteroyltriglutamate--homocysteine methyltransferase [Betaproteobacteria bacterium]|nr:5-methyltetrahydropteroyltriglutamate--homocysteine methyltransferase [Betaproteobacteria bacterium]